MLKKSSLCVWALCLFLFLSKQCGAEEDPLELPDLPSKNGFSDTIVVTAEKDDLVAPLQKELGFVSVIEPAKRNGAIEETSDLLENVVGVNVTQYGGLGMFSFVSIRGSEANQVSYFLNGIPLNSANSGGLNLASIPLTFLDSVEVYRGWVPSSLGQASLGGAVNFVTSSDKQPTAGHISLSHGSFDTNQSTVTFQHNGSNQHFFFHGGYSCSDGDYPFLNDNGTSNNRSDDHYVLRTNSDFSAYETLFSYQHRMSGQTLLSMTGTYIDRSHGLPGIGNIQTTATRLDSRSAMLHFRVERLELFHGADFLQTNLYYTHNTDLFDDPEHEMSLYTEESLTTTSKSGLGLNYSLDWSARHIFSASLEAIYEQNVSKNELRGPFPSNSIDRTRWTWALSVDDEMRFFSSALLMRPSIRWDGTSNRDKGPDDGSFQSSSGTRDNWSYFSPQIAVKWSLSAHVSAKSSIGYYSRYPSMNELYGDRGTSMGNPELEPETGINRDIGFFVQNGSHHSLHFFLEYAFFVKESRDLMVYIQNSQFTFKAENLGAARISGHELSTSFRAGELLLLTMNYTFQDGRDTGSIPYYRGNHLPNRPVQELSSSINLTIAPVSLGYSLFYQSQNYLDRANRKEVPERLTHNASVRWENVIQGFSLTLEMKNISDNQISDVAGYPLPGRSYYATISYRF